MGVEVGCGHQRCRGDGSSRGGRSQGGGSPRSVLEGLLGGIEEVVRLRESRLRLPRLRRRAGARPSWRDISRDLVRRKSAWLDGDILQAGAGGDLARGDVDVDDGGFPGEVGRGAEQGSRDLFRGEGDRHSRVGDGRWGGIAALMGRPEGGLVRADRAGGRPGTLGNPRGRDCRGGNILVLASDLGEKQRAVSSDRRTGRGCLASAHSRRVGVLRGRRLEGVD